MQSSHINPPVVVFWAVVRMVLGIAQMTGAIVSATLLLRLGLARETLIAVSITMVCTLGSIVLFKWLKVQKYRRH